MINWDNVKNHLVVFTHGLLAAVAMAALQAVLSYLSHVDWNHLLSLMFDGAGAAVAANIKYRHG